MTCYGFRPFTGADLPLVACWLKTPEVIRWWGDPEREPAVLAQDLDEPSQSIPTLQIKERAALLRGQASKETRS
jgi:hypothetical protein